MATVTMTGTVTVNAAFLQEIKDVNQDLWRLLSNARRMSHEPAMIYAAPRRFFGLIEQLRDQLALHFALEEAYGYFDDPVEVAPRLCEQAERLRAEHRDLYLSAVALTEFAEQLLLASNNGRLILESARQFRAFDDRFQQHERAENQLILEEYDNDIGVGD
ncbi:MAG: hypothetical protein CMJ64_08485 [Planctomycetaceae bacterium]|nr:hypothetical protein [Planctomycetaceae bacterium]